MLKWTSEPPKEPGWYYMKDTFKGVSMCRVDIFQKTIGLGEYLTITNKMPLLSNNNTPFGQPIIIGWAGPIPEPEDSND